MRWKTVSSFMLCVMLVSVSISVVADSQMEDMSFAPPSGYVRNIAEFERMEGVLVRYPFGISTSIIAEMSEDVIVYTLVGSGSEQSTVTTQYQSAGVNMNNVEFFITSTDSYWTRDYGPWYICDEDSVGIVDFPYNRPRPNDNQVPSFVASGLGIDYYYMPLTQTGGNYMTDGLGSSVSTELVWDENSGLTHSEIDELMLEYLGIEQYYVVPDVNGEYIQHVDCWGKYLSPDTILIREVPSSHSQYDEIEDAVEYFESQISAYGTPYNVVRVYTPGDEPYTNSLILNDKVLVPMTGGSWDDEAIDSYEDAMPGYEVIGCSGSWYSTDALHCRTKGVPDRGMLYIEHVPLSGTVTMTCDGVQIDATIIPYSEETVTSAEIVYRVNGGSWYQASLNHDAGDEYVGFIPLQEESDTVEYYLEVSDASGRTETHPLIGEADSHVFVVENGCNGEAPATPSPPSGPSIGAPGTSYSFEVSTTDPDGDDVLYRFDWGDGVVSDWFGPVTSGDPFSASYAWSMVGTYDVLVQAKDASYGLESGWSSPHVIEIATADLSIGLMGGGFLHVSSAIENVGAIAASDLEWSLVADGGLFLMGAETTGSNDSLAPGESLSVSSSPMFGFGSCSFTLTASASNADEEARTQTGTAFLIFIKVNTY